MIFINIEKFKLSCREHIVKHATLNWLILTLPLYYVVSTDYKECETLMTQRKMHKVASEFKKNIKYTYIWEVITVKWPLIKLAQLLWTFYCEIINTLNHQTVRILGVIVPHFRLLIYDEKECENPEKQGLFKRKVIKVIFWGGKGRTSEMNTWAIVL